MPSVDYSILQLEALVALYESTNGGSWTTKTNWQTSESVCTWSGVTCNGDIVKELRLDGNNLQGTTAQFYFYVLFYFFLILNENFTSFFKYSRDYTN